MSIRTALLDGFEILIRRGAVHSATDGVAAKVLGLGLLFVNELHLLISEGSIAYPVGAEWRIMRLKDWHRRSVPTLSAVVSHTRHGSSEHVQLLGAIYTFEGFVEVESGDIVFDVGAYVGGFTTFAAETAERVIAVEPSATIHDSLWYNLRDKENTTVVPKAAWNRTEALEMTESVFPDKNTVNHPKFGNIGTTYAVTADTVQNIGTEHGVDRIDFLKIEAEGVEPEILRGALDGDIPVQKIAIDAGPERNGEPVTDPVTSLLEKHGYEWRVKTDALAWGENIVFARKQADEGT